MKALKEMTDAEVAAELNEYSPFGGYTLLQVMRHPITHRAALASYRKTGGC